MKAEGTEGWEICLIKLEDDGIATPNRRSPLGMLEGNARTSLLLQHQEQHSAPQSESRPLSPPLTDCVIFDKLCDLADPLFPLCKMGW